MDARDLSLEAGVGGRAHRHERSAGCVLFSDTHADVAKRAAHASGFAFEVFFKGRKQGTLPRFHPIKRLVEARQRRFRIGLASHQPSENCRQAARFEARAAIGISGAIGVARFGPAAWIGQGAERIGSPLEDRLTAHQLLEFLRQLFLIKHLPAGRTVDAGPHLSDLIFVRKSHFGLMLNEPLQDIVVKCKIGRRHRGPAGEDGQRANDDPERYAPDTHRPAAVEQRAAALWHIAPGARTRRGGAAARAGSPHRAGTGCNGEHNAGHDGLEHSRRPHGRRARLQRGGTPTGRTSTLTRRSCPAPHAQAADWTKPALIISKQAPHSLSSRAAARTSSACPSTLTFGQMRAMRPFGPIRTVVRVIP